ncbi:MAG: hypothetical protein Q7T16_02555 [Candidatus Burarchaeum sp.]|nr:hypothetical protein [Candidatus Burarchaeum sp.]MDO8339515.1 hypothetical protein [Candidatus Burarchaeum sp.]
MEQREPFGYSIIAAPFRFVKGIFRRALGMLPLTNYALEKRKRDKQELMEEMSDVLRSSKELERKAADVKE